MPTQFWSDLIKIHNFINSNWRPLHVWLVQKRIWSKLIMRLATALVLLILVLATATYLFSFKNYYLIYALGVKSADVAVTFYIASLIPGMLKRLDILAMPRASLMLFRRELGDLAFLAALTHGSVVRLLPKILNPILLGILPPLPELLGMSALFVLIPLYVTSNDLMVAKLGPLWSKIHRLTYLALGLLIMHTAWFSFKVSFLLMIVGIIEIASYTKSYWIKYLPSQG